ncbi:RidA family protein [Actinosynnema sp. NPDC050801]|uniref:RidA family protein n=1 Tax=unclassified Actinosynnema TaxID=2637065 RepID=UPI0033F34EEC
MNLQRVDPSHLADPGLTNGVLVTGAQRWLFVTAQPPFTDGETVPDGFDAQCRQAWRNVLAVLAEAGMGVPNIVKVGIYLASRDDREANSMIRQEILGDHRASMSIIVADMWDESWLVEIDAVAAA